MDHKYRSNTMRCYYKNYNFYELNAVTVTQINDVTSSLDLPDVGGRKNMLRHEKAAYKRMEAVL